MIEWIQNFIRNYSNGMYFPHIQIKDIIEILIVTIIVYEIMLWIKNTKAWMLLRGMLMLGGFILLAWLFQMNTILYLAKESINVLAIAAIVVFQPELRRALEKLGEKNLFSNINPFDKNKENQRFSDETLDSIVRACYAMGSVCTGALIVVEQVIQLTEYEMTGIELDCKVSSQVLINIFEHNTPLHDGAVIIAADFAEGESGDAADQRRCEHDAHDQYDDQVLLQLFHRLSFPLSPALRSSSWLLASSRACCVSFCLDSERSSASIVFLWLSCSSLKACFVLRSLYCASSSAF